MPAENTRKMTGIYIFRRITYHFESICGIEMVAGAHRSQQISNKCFGKQKRIGGNEEIHFKRRKSIPEYSLKMQWHMICQSGFQCDFRGIQCCLFYSENEKQRNAHRICCGIALTEREREIRYSLWYRFCENTIHLVLWEFGEITNERCEACGKRTKEDAQAFAKELMCTMYISIGKRLFGVCVFLAESEKWNIARYLPISLRYSHEKRLSNKYCVLCCAACWQTRRGNCNRMLIKLVRIIYVWYVRSII